MLDVGRVVLTTIPNPRRSRGNAYPLRHVLAIRDVDAGVKAGNSESDRESPQAGRYG